jgi:Zn-dependent metalloprotease
VAHEYTHGVTQFESGLLYQNASGAMNEAFSDIWGEFVDLGNGRGNDSSGVRWLVGEDLSGGAIRDMRNPGSRNDPDRLGTNLFQLGSSTPNTGNDFGGVHSNSGVVNKLCFLLTDGGSFNGYSVTGLGIDRIAALFYEANSNILGSSPDYVDLSAALHQAAANKGWNANEIASLHRACLAVEIVNNWVDASNGTGSGNGCRRPNVNQGGPFPRVALGVTAVQSGDPLYVRAGSYNERFTITKPMRIVAYEGAVTIGR